MDICYIVVKTYSVSLNNNPEGYNKNFTLLFTIIIFKLPHRSSYLGSQCKLNFKTAMYNHVQSRCPLLMIMEAIQHRGFGPRNIQFQLLEAIFLHTCQMRA